MYVQISDTLLKFCCSFKYIIIDRAIWYIVDSAVCAIVHIL